MVKYHSKKVIHNGEKFDSKKECARFCQLSLLEKAGVIKNLRRQVKFELIPSQKINGKVVEHACAYVADFVYEMDGKTIVEDTKGYKTKDYIIKRKLMLYLKNIQISEV